MSFNKHLKRNGKFLHHNLEIVIVDRPYPHMYECRCKECNCHVKWSSRAEHIWYNVRTSFSQSVDFRSLYNKGVDKLFTFCWLEAQKEKDNAVNAEALEDKQRKQLDRTGDEIYNETY